MPATLTDLRENIDVPSVGHVYAAPTTLTPLTEIGGTARRLIVDTISGPLVITQLNGTTLTFSANHLTKLNGIVDHKCTAIQSAACTGIMAVK